MKGFVVTYFETTPFPVMAQNFHAWFDAWRHNLDARGIQVMVTDQPDEMPPMVHVDLTREDRQAELYILFYLGAVEWFFTDPEDITHNFFHLDALDLATGYETLFTQALHHLAPEVSATAAAPVADSAPATTAEIKLPQQLQLLGYWRGGTTAADYPDPNDLIDWRWNEDDREFITAYLKTGMVARTYMGYSPCRICGKNNGVLELTDGYYVWPDGLAHYVADHGVRLPQVFVDHAYNLTLALETANNNRDETWWQNLGSEV